MSASGTKRTYRVALHMSAFGGKADMTFCGANVCAFDPKRTLWDCLNKFAPSGSLVRVVTVP
jgi:hypothetical protein